MKITLENLHMYCDECGDCLQWRLSRNSAGSPQANIDGRTQLVRRYVFTELLGRKVNGRHTRVTVTCGDELCVEPSHLVGRTYGEVLQRTYSSGARSGATEYVKRLDQARRAGMAKLDWDKVREIRALSPQTLQSIANAYGIDPRTASSILKGESWRERMPGASVFDLARAA